MIREPNNRSPILTKKVETPFGSMYCHVSHDGRRATGLSFSTPGKCDNTELDAVIVSLGAAADQLIREINGSGNGGDGRELIKLAGEA